MKLMNIDSDTLFYLGKIQPVTLNTLSRTSVGLTIPLGDSIDPRIPNSFCLTDGSDDVDFLVDINLEDYSFRDIGVLGNSVILKATRRKSKTRHRLIVTGTQWNVMAGTPTVKGVVFENPNDISKCRVLASGVMRYNDKFLVNSLLSLPDNVYYVLGDEVYSVKDDNLVNPRQGVFFYTADLVNKLIKY